MDNYCANMGCFCHMNALRAAFEELARVHEKRQAEAKEEKEGGQ